MVDLGEAEIANAREWAVVVQATLTTCRKRSLDVQLLRHPFVSRLQRQSLHLRRLPRQCGVCRCIIMSVNCHWLNVLLLDRASCVGAPTSQVTLSGRDLLAFDKIKPTSIPREHSTARALTADLT